MTGVGPLRNFEVKIIAEATVMVPALDSEQAGQMMLSYAPWSQWREATAAHRGQLALSGNTWSPRDHIVHHTRWLYCL